MKKRVYIVHGWGGYPHEGWYPWLKKELEAKGFEVHVPALPETEQPHIDNWIPKLAEVVGITDENTYFVGHSMGCSTIARYLETLPDNVKVGGVVFVAGFFKQITGFENTENERATKKHWLTSPLNLAKVRSHLLKSIAIFSDNDPCVPLDNQDDFRDKLASEIIIRQKMGHFSQDDGITELPIVLESILKICTIQVYHTG